jgi:hypothetical protein
MFKPLRATALRMAGRSSAPCACTILAEQK